ncbi:hypothetical protein ABXS69_04490 [Actinomyces timonensis]|uniref:Phosphatidate cytidylyltransferase n=1 Tax=Actinomyces timonensis TaxID=1288391 RepID=A0AAU8N6W1_9ACTO
MPSTSRGHSFLIAACVIGVAWMFSQGIPWWAWAAAFLLLLAEAEFLSRSMASKSPSAREHLGKKLIAAAIASALLLIGSLFLLALPV